MHLSLQTPKQALNKAFLKEKVSRDAIEQFKQHFKALLSRINEAESEENNKNSVADFLKNVWYRDEYEINTKGRTDLVIHAGKTAKDPAGVLLEVKRPGGSKAEMMSAAKPNSKALQELVLYYLRERLEHSNTSIRYLVITDVWEWFIIDEAWFEENVFRSVKIRKSYEEWKQSGKDTRFFYESVVAPHLNSITINLPCTHFNLQDYRNVVNNAERADDNKLIPLYKILSPVHLLKLPFANDSNSLNSKFYAELLHIVGLEEVKEKGKKLIRRKADPNEASLLENTIAKLEERDSLYKVENLSFYGTSKAEQLQSIALELCITWINRVLFMKLLEAQLLKYHKGDKAYRFLDTEHIHDYDELSNLFFGVLAEKPALRKNRLQQKFSKVPYLNSSLFERIELEFTALEIALLDNRLLLPVHNATVLKDSKGKKLSGTLPTLDYLFRFLEAYDFTSEGAEEIQEENKNLINASVLGLIFEKINGYKDGSFFTPGFVTMYMCKEVIRRAVLEKFNRLTRIAKGDTDDTPDRYKTLEDIYNAGGRDFSKETANGYMNSLTICDPSVGSGHFLVSALNEIIAIKSELRLLVDREGKSLHHYHVEVVNDELIITDEDGRLFEYHSHSKESRRVQEALFHEKQTIIENCLFGVDLNPNSVKICRLRLWIELLKHAYYTEASGFNELETLPNIDINIKTGNSLISRFALDEDLSKALKSIKWDITAYQGFVHDYKNATDKEEKRGLEKLIDEIKKDFRREIGKNDPIIKRLAKVNGEYDALMNQQQIFELNKSEQKARKEKAQKLEKEISKLSAQIEEIKSNKIYEHAFEWRFEFPEILDSEGRFVGFDVVIGNPPYVQIQKFTESDKKGLEQQGFQTFSRTGDVYQLFYERGVGLLKPNGHLCYITSNKWMRTDYGDVTRRFLSAETRTELVVDFGMAQMFDAATTYTNILLLQKASPSDTIRMCRIKSDYDPTVLLEDYVDFSAVEIDSPGENSWIAYEREEYELIKKIERQGRPIKEWNIQINRGILTGFNEAFIIDSETRDRLVQEDPRSAEIIKPILRGEDIRAYSPDWAGKWLINSHNGIKSAGVPRIDVAKEYPAVFRWLSQFEATLAKRFDKGDHWSNLRNCAYLAEFSKPKIIYPNMTKYLPFVYDKHQFFTNDKAFIITGDNLEYLTCFLNSKLFRFAFKDCFPELLGDTREVRKVFFENVPIKTPDNEQWYKDTLEVLLQRKAKGISTEALESKIDERLFRLYDLTREEVAVIAGASESGPSVRELSSATSLSDNP